MKKFLLSFILLLGAIFVHAQVTTSSMTGTVLQSDGQASIGASVKATHVPSGTVYGGSTNENGRFNLANMRIGGPYTVEITYIGSQPAKYENIILQLGQPYVLNAQLTDGLALEEVVISATASTLNADKTGAGTNINTQQLTQLPTIDRSITDFTRLTPQASGNSFGGRDGRYNNLQIDGSNFNNGFGLNDNALPGGGRSQPISLDAVEEIQVNIAPFDVRQSGFTGAGINAVTRSGTNQFTGSAYYFFNNQSFQGRKIGDVELAEPQDASTKNFGVRLGGPIIKNKLFFFGNFERQVDKGANASGANLWRPSENGVADPTNNIARTTIADLEAVRNHLINTWGYDPGRYQGYANEASQPSTKFLARLDWNISDKHKMAVRYNQMIAEANSLTNGNSGPYPRAGSAYQRVGQNSISFENANYSTKDIVRSITGELNSTFNSTISNQFLATYSRIQSKRESPSAEFPFVDIGDGTGYPSSFNTYMSLGYELFSYNNDVVNDNYSFVDNLTINAGKHTITAGAAFEIQKFGNSYVRLGTSYYRYNSVADFLTTGTPNEVAPIMFGVTYPYEGQDPYSRINYGLASLYAQDRFSVADNLDVTFGLRAELPIYMNKLTPNPSINALTLLDQYGLPKNYDSGSWPKSRIMLSPRIGFNYDVNGDRSLVIRGGTGLFTGRVPFVWLTNMPTNSGVIQNNVEPGSYEDVAGWIGNVRFNPDKYYWVNNPPAGGEDVFIGTPNEGAPGSFALVDRDFKMPKVWRTSLGADYSIPNTPLVATADILYTKDINAAYQYGANRAIPTTRLNYGSSGEAGDYGDTRYYFPTSADRAYNPQFGANAGTILTNTSVRGHAFSATMGVSLPARKGFFGSIYYTYSEAKEVSGNPGSSASSAWGGSPSINSPNEQLLYNSDFAVPHRVVGSISYRAEYVKHLATTVSLFYDGSSQGRFSYTYNGDINNDGLSGADLIYLPRNSNDLNFVPLTVTSNSGAVLLTATPEEQRAAFDQYVANNGLEKYRGEYLKRNDFTMPWLNRFDLRVLQDIFTDIGPRRHTLQFSVDIFNVGNLLNKNWGIAETLTPATNLLRVASVSPEGVPSFTMNTTSVDGETQLVSSPFQNASTYSTTWRMQLGFRYIF
ncbi:TonB-dependent receptor [Olivibacter sp. XZL3]|uniref:TonB-dependent receptor n=1 Tax=Olivibacter sp. XZL3 TaxID=1735116 RepID=UPI001065087C|nr:carboxypeptidase regulatory-like domain-containing protein [Olivibacter sp. XZL3]